MHVEVRVVEYGNQKPAVWRDDGSVHKIRVLDNVERLRLFASFKVAQADENDGAVIVGQDGDRLGVGVGGCGKVGGRRPEGHTVDSISSKLSALCYQALVRYAGLGEEREERIVIDALETEMSSQVDVEIETRWRLDSFLSIFVETNGDKFARLAAAAKPTITDDKTAGRKGEEFDGFALVGDGVETLDVVAAVASGEVDEMSFLGADEGAQLPVLRADRDTVMLADVPGDDGVGGIGRSIINGSHGPWPPSGGN